MPELQTLTLRQAIDIIESGRAFDIEYCTADMARGTGGELKAYSGVTTTTAMPRTGGKKKFGEKVLTKRVNPHHEANSTINLYIPAAPVNERLRKVHTRLITKINGKEVT